MTTALIRASFHDQAAACTAMGSPLTGRVLRLLADRLTTGAVASRVLGWQGDPAGKADALALRLAGGLHALVLSGTSPGLAAAYAGPETSDPALWAALAEALNDHEAHLLHWLECPPQTNEVRRSAVLIAAGHLLARRHGLPMVLSELGASAGLNLWWDHYALTAKGILCGPRNAPVHLTPDWQGPAPVPCPPTITARAGVDLSPLDPVADRLRILSYIWPDQPERMARTIAAADLAAQTPGLVARGDAVDWLETRLATRHPGQVHLIFHTVAWQYFPQQTQAKGEALFAAAGARATPDAPLARLAMEADGHPDGAAITLTEWPGTGRQTLGRADFHGRWLHWQGPA